MPTPAQKKATAPRPPGIHPGAVGGWCFGRSLLARTGKLLLALIVMWGSSAPAASNKTLTWDASPQSGVAGYKIYYGTASYNYTQTVTVGNVTSATIDGLAAGVTYYFAVTAIYGSGEESDFSNEAIYVVPGSVVPQLQIGPQPDGTVQLTGLGAAGHTYEILATSDFAIWTTIATRLADANGYFAAIDPNPANSPMRMYLLQDLGYTSLVTAPGIQLRLSVNPDQVVSLTGMGQGGHTYEIQTSTDLSTWSALGSQTADTSGAFAFTDYDAPNYPSRFYRALDTRL